MQHEVDEDFARYVRARQHSFLRAAYLLCGDAGVAEEVCRRAFTSLALRWDRVRAGDPDAHVRRVLYRDALSALRRARRESIAGALLQLDDDGPARTDRVDVHEALAALTPKQRAVVVLRYLEERSVDDSAEVLGTSAAAVEGLARAALARLRTRVPDLEAGLAGEALP
ncbi:sigma-70 family RNA polymerase sigma factor [Pedococcus sp. NPDC057267]|uniref:sigma-70 family RNA polymerase sigma factor n=1 Tax=Pedococcus sp. NPDC057267 TaxID=3346077 RepID=UPI00362FCCFE